MEKLHTLIDLTDCDVLDIGAATGRSAIGAAKKAKRVFAVDYYESVVFFGKSQLQQTCTINVHYINGDRDHSPLPKNSMDVVINAWAELNPLGAIPNALCGELTSQLVHDYPWLPKDCAPLEVFEPGYPDTCFTADSSIM